MSPASFYVPFQLDGLVLAAEHDGEVIGFACTQVCADALHLWEVAVARAAQKLGAGRALMTAVSALARARRLDAVTLTTFRDIPWNGPFYGRLGYRELGPDELNPRLAGVVARETDLGLDMAARCVMRLELQRMGGA